MACMIHVSGNRTRFDFDGSSALVKVNEDGKINIITGEIDLGQGCNTVFAQIVGEELGISFEDITVSLFDSEISPYALGPHASRTTHLAGNAVKLAAMDAKRQLLEFASKRLEANTDDLVMSSGRVFVKGSPEKGLTLLEIIKSSAYSRGGALIVGKGVYDPDTVMPDKTGFGNISSAYSFAAHIAEVSVDVNTGKVLVLNYVVAHDLGKSINPMGAEGQVQGGVAQGIGYGLTEELFFEKGKILNDTFRDYKTLTSLDVPPIDIIFVESQDPNGPFGAKSLGEPSLVPVAPAIANAIYDAIGVRIKELPITAEKILEELKKSKRR